MEEKKQVEAFHPLPPPLDATYRFPAVHPAPLSPDKNSGKLGDGELSDVDIGDGAKEGPVTVSGKKEDDDGNGEGDGELSDVDIGNGGSPVPELASSPVPVLSEKDEDDGDPKSLVREKEECLVWPHQLLPQPEAPPGLLTKSHSAPGPRSLTEDLVSDSSPPTSLGKLIRDRGSGISSALVKRFSSLRESAAAAGAGLSVTEFHLRGLKVVVQLKEEDDGTGFRGRISFFSRSGCRDCGAVRAFFREKRLRFVEINVDVYPEREAELVERTGSKAVPAIFFNEKLVGGLVALNSLRNSGEFDRRLWEVAGRRCPESAPKAPVYGFEDEEGEKGRKADEMVALVRVLRQRLPIQDRLARMKLCRNCFAGGEMVEAIIHHLDCGRKKAIEIGRVLARKHFIHHVFREHDFEDGNHFYRFLEHEPTIPKCYNFRSTTNDDEPKPAALVGRMLTKIMSAILESYTSVDRRHVDYDRISKSEEFRRYVNMAQDLQRVDVMALSADEKLAFFINLYNAMVIHAVIRLGAPEGAIDRRSFYGDFHYVIGGYPYSLTTIKNGILRANRRQPYSLSKPFSSTDQRLEVAVEKVNPLIHFGLCNATRSSPSVRFFSADGMEAELRYAAREFFLGDGIDVDLDKRTVHLTRIIKWYSVDFGEEKEILKWVLTYLDATKAGLLTHLLSDGGPVHIVYKDYDWSLNS